MGSTREISSSVFMSRFRPSTEISRILKFLWSQFRYYTLHGAYNKCTVQTALQSLVCALYTEQNIYFVCLMFVCLMFVCLRVCMFACLCVCVFFLGGLRSVDLA